MTVAPFKIVATMTRDDTGQVYEVGEHDGKTYFRARRSQKWNQVHPGFNPTTDAYLTNCAENFGWAIERIGN